MQAASVLTFKNLFRIVAGILALLLTANTLTYLNFDFQYGFLRLKQKAIASGWYLPFYYSHILVGGIILIAGLFQLQPLKYWWYKKIHRIGGYIYVIGILCFAAPGALVMSLFIDRGIGVLASFLIQGVLWFYFTAIAFHRIRQRMIIEHQKWMWRSYALTFAAVTLRIYIFLFSWGYNLNQPEAYATLALISWLPNLIVVEFALRTGLIGNKANAKVLS